MLTDLSKLFDIEKTLPDSRDANQRNFAIISGNFPETGIAIPLSPRPVLLVALRELLEYKGRTFFNRIKVRALLLFPYLTPLFSKGKFSIALGGGSDNISKLLRERFGEDMSFSIYAGSRKFILPLFNRSGKVLGYAKAYFPGMESEEYGEREVKILNKLSGIGLSEIRVPRVIFAEYYKGFFIEILSTCEGHKSLRGASETHMRWLRELMDKTGKDELFEESEFWKELRRGVSFLKTKISQKSDLLDYFVSSAERGLSGRKFKFGLTMREFPYFQMMQCDNGFLAIDFEEADFGYPPVFDLFSLLMSARRRQGDYEKIYAENIKELFFKPSSYTKEYLLPFLEFAGLTTEEAYWFFLLFLLDQLYIHVHAGHENSAARVTSLLNEIHRAPDVFKKRWLVSKK